MNWGNIVAARKEAERFLECVDILEMTIGNKSNWGSWENPKQRGALRRASMDLTRALAEMRKP